MKLDDVRPGMHVSYVLANRPAVVMSGRIIRVAVRTIEVRSSIGGKVYTVVVPRSGVKHAEWK